MKTLTVALAASLVLVGCLPADTRPVPAHVTVRVERDPELGDGPASFTSDDGWKVTLQELLVSIGDTELLGDKCTDYSESGYRRLLDLNRPGLQKLGELFGLNDCTLVFGVSVPHDDTVLGKGVTADDLEFMNTASVAVSSESGPTTAEGMSLHVVGQAEKDGTTVSFDWGLSDRIDFLDCRRQLGESFESSLPLGGGKSLSVRIVVDPRNLFQIGLDPKLAPPATPTYGFHGDDSPPQLDGVDPAEAVAALPPMSLVELIVDADQLSGDANGRVSVEELSAVSVPGATLELNLAELLRLVTSTTLYRYEDTGQCAVVTLHDRGHGDDFF
ncbi:MAG: hypothetical protein JW940_28715 [Polyangiaceae bacterium]|nr:hypothetical protein [Polyangiaceae bacterium]